MHIDNVKMNKTHSGKNVMFIFCFVFPLQYIDVVLQNFQNWRCLCIDVFFSVVHLTNVIGT